MDRNLTPVAMGVKVAIAILPYPSVHPSEAMNYLTRPRGQPGHTPTRAAVGRSPGTRDSTPRDRTS